MCRFVFYRGRKIPMSLLLTEPKHSLIRQSFESTEREEPLNGDGFGVGWYVDGHEKPAMFHSVTPAWNNENLMDLARVTVSGCMLAHVRAATQGISVISSNCHPFRRGNLSFMHNGDFGGFQVFRRELLMELSESSFRALKGTTDSEHFFAVVADEYGKLPVGHSEAHRMADAFKSAIRYMRTLMQKFVPEEDIYLNAVMTNGTSAVACRVTTDKPEHADSLYIHRGKKYVCEDGVCRMVLPGMDDAAMIISSEPLSDDAGWDPIPVNTIVLSHSNNHIEFEPVEL